MTKRSNRFIRSIATKNIKKLFYIFVEGEKTEPFYFNMIKKKYNKNVTIHLISSNKDWSCDTHTTVYKLIEEIINSNNFIT